MKEFLKEIFSQRNKGVENSTSPKDTEVETQTKMSLTDRYNTWWEQENAKAFFAAISRIWCADISSRTNFFYEVCFGAILDKFSFLMENGDISRKRNLTVRIQRFVYRLYAQMFMD